MMLKGHATVTALWQLTEWSVIRKRWKLTCLHRKLGTVPFRSTGKPAPLLKATPSRALIDEPIIIEGSFLPPHWPVTVRAQMHSEDGDLWEALSHYSTDGKGTVNLARDPSVGGSYLGCEPMGLFWGLHPAPGGRQHVRLRKINVETPYLVQLSLFEGHVSPSESLHEEGQNSEQLASVTVERWYMAPGVRRIEIRQDGIVGTLFLPPGPGPFPAMIDMWGMGGGLNEYRSALFASRGFASLALVYFKHKEMPGPPNCVVVGDSYFRSAFQLLQDHPQVCGDRIGVMGFSFGVYLALRMATQIDCSPKCLIGVNGPMGNVNNFYICDRSTESYENPETYWQSDGQDYVSYRKASSPSTVFPEKKIKLENLACPLLCIVGEDDQNTASKENATEMEETLRAAGRAHLFTCLSYPGAGHLIEPPYTPNTRISTWANKPKKSRPYKLEDIRLSVHSLDDEESFEGIRVPGMYTEDITELLKITKGWLKDHIMLKGHVNMKALWQLTDISVMQRSWKLTCLRRKLGKDGTVFSIFQVGLHSANHRTVPWRSNGKKPAPLLKATPSRALIDEPIIIEGAFLPPHWPVTVRAQMHSEDGDLWEALSHYSTDGKGTVNLARHPSVGGSYLGCEPMGLFWGLHPAPGERQYVRLRKINVETPLLVQLSLFEGHVSPSESLSEEGQSSEQLASVTVERWYMAPGVRRIEIRQDGIVGTLFLPPGPGPFPAMLDLWGMGGGLNEYRSALFASRGFASLAVVYFNHKEIRPGPLNRVSVGDSYFRSAFQLLQDHPQVCGDRIGVIGLSFGGYIALRIATQIGVSPKCVICVNGPMGNVNNIYISDPITESYESHQPYWQSDGQGYVTIRESLPSSILPENKIKFENLACPLLCIVGEDDQNASSIENATEMEETLKAAGRAHLFTCLSYPGAGHLIEPPYTPNTRISTWVNKPKRLLTVWGGHPASHAAAQEDSWKKILKFMECNLRG